MFSGVICPEGWVMREGFCYVYVKEPKSWKDASSDCIEKGGNLTSIHNKKEHDFIFSKFLSTFLII